MSNAYDSQKPGSPASLHEVLWALGKQLFSGTSIKPIEPAASRRDYSEGLLSSKVQAVAVQQLTTAMRMRGLRPGDETLLDSLQQMMLAGEISFADFIGRIENLFPKMLDALDVSLRMKIAALVMAPDQNS